MLLSSIAVVEYDGIGLMVSPSVHGGEPESSVESYRERNTGAAYARKSFIYVCQKNNKKDISQKLSNTVLIYRMYLFRLF